jgi:ribose 5-phosphate isomerase B
MFDNEIYIGADDAAVDFKNALADFLRKKGFTVTDFGEFKADSDVLYPDVAAKVCKAVIASGFKKRGILVCGTGIGMAMTANKFPGIRAAQVHDSFSAERAALSNDANVITMGARVIGIELGKKLALEWLGLEFKPGPSSPKVEAIKRIERENLK